jgi:hypothetical protein
MLQYLPNASVHNIQMAKAKKTHAPHSSPVTSALTTFVLLPILQFMASATDAIKYHQRSDAQSSECQ